MGRVVPSLPAASKVAKLANEMSERKSGKRARAAASSARQANGQLCSAVQFQSPFYCSSFRFIAND